VAARLDARERHILRGRYIVAEEENCHLFLRRIPGSDDGAASRFLGGIRRSGQLH
jgi:hypothetical protein